MSRAIKFRAWFRPTQEYKSRYLDRHKHELESLYWRNYTQEDFLDDSWIDTDDFEEIIFEQYTGSKDKNGKEIYEGDILDSPQGRCLCVWGDDGWAYQFKVHRTDWFDIVKDWHEKTEVIGNIHENPELLEGKNE